MKKVMLTLSFLFGISCFTAFDAKATGVNLITIEGKAEGWLDNGTLYVSCYGIGECVSIYKTDKGEIRIKIPDLNVDLQLSSTSTLNDQDVNTVSPNLPNGDYVIEGVMN